MDLARNPIISIRYNRFLDPIFVGWIKAQPQWKDWEQPSMEIVRKGVDDYIQIWKKHESAILDGLYTATGFRFLRNYIDIFVVSGNPRPFSRPIVVKARYAPDEFLCIATHELIHCLFSDNAAFREPYPENPHITVHAILKHIYLDVLKRPELLVLNKASSAKSEISEYRDAWEAIEGMGYQSVIEKVRSQAGK